MQIVCCFGDGVDSLCARSKGAPTIDQLRPAFCPVCAQAVRFDSGLLAIIGNGYYKRQLLGLADAPDLLISVRRFRCRACGVSISTPPDQVHPYRWYASVAILQALWLRLLLGVTARGVSTRLRGVATSSWRSLRRWSQQVLESSTLWGWLGRSLGVDDQTPPVARVGRFIAQAIAPGDQPDAAQVAAAARVSLAELTYCRGQEPVSLHVLADNLARQASAGTRLGGNTQGDGYPGRPP